MKTTPQKSIIEKQIDDALSSRKRLSNETTVDFVPLIIIKDKKETYQEMRIEEKPFRPSDYLGGGY